MHTTIIPWLFVFFLGSFLALPGCPSDTDDDDAAGGLDDDDTSSDDDDSGAADDDDSAGGLEDTAFEEFAPWADPLLDYVEAMIPEYGEGGFHTTIWDLALYQDRLYFGYGDADIYLADADFTEFTPLTSYSGSPAPVSLAYWEQLLYLGMDDGTLWRAQPL